MGVVKTVDRDISRERHLRAVAVWYRIAGVLFFFGTLFFFATVGNPGALTVGLGLGLGVGCYAIGHHLWEYRNEARLAAFLLSATGLVHQVDAIVNMFVLTYHTYARTNLLLCPPLDKLIFTFLGIAWTMAVLWLLMSERSAAIFTERYSWAVSREESRSVPFWTSAFFLLPFIDLAVSLWHLAATNRLAI
jgi:hypothetical protein